MSVRRRSVPPSPPTATDLEATAELPVLEVAASDQAAMVDRLANTDTWTALAPVLTPEVPDDREALKQRNRLESDLKSLSASLQEFEERLALKGEHLTALEKELEQERLERAAAETRVQATQAELGEARAELQRARSEIAELQLSVKSRDDAVRSVEEQGRAVSADLEQRQRALTELQGRLTEAQQRAAAQLESLQRLEGRRSVFDATLRELDAQVASGTERITALESEVSAGAQLAGQLQSQLAASVERVRVLETEALSRTQSHDGAVLAAAERARVLEEERGAQQRRGDELQTQLASERAASAAARETHAQELADRQREHEAAVRELHGELRLRAERATAADESVRHSAETIARLEAQLREAQTRHEDAVRLQEELRGFVEAARQELADRDALIRRLETEAAHSSALLENIQHSMRRLEPQKNETSEIMPEGPMRLLIRIEGEGEVVHVLGRKTSIGRTPENDVQIDTKFISRHHAVILAGPVHTIIEDLNSTNGVLVNGRKVTRQTLKDGDNVIVGKTQFRFAVRPAAERRAG